MAIIQTKRTDRLFGALILGCILLIFWQIFIYEKTFIPLVIPLSVWLLTGIVITILSRGKFIYQPTPSLFLQLLFNIIVWGGLALFSFMWGNYHFCNKTTSVIHEKIVSTGRLSGRNGSCEQPYVVVIYKGREKQLMFDCDTPVENFNGVDLTISKGLFGFDILVRSTLKTD